MNKIIKALVSTVIAVLAYALVIAIFEGNFNSQDWSMITVFGIIFFVAEYFITPKIKTATTVKSSKKKSK